MLGAGTKGNLKRPGMPLLGSSRKKLPGMIPLMDYVAAMAKQQYDGEQKHQNAEGEGASVGAEDGGCYGL